MMNGLLVNCQNREMAHRNAKIAEIAKLPKF